MIFTITTHKLNHNQTIIDNTTNYEPVWKNSMNLAWAISKHPYELSRLSNHKLTNHPLTGSSTGRGSRFGRPADASNEAPGAPGLEWTQGMVSGGQSWFDG